MSIFKKIDKYFLALIVISILPLYPLLQPGMFLAHDSESHVARLVAFYQSLSEGNIIPRWAGNLNNGFGHPILMFLYPLSNYLGSLWHFLGLSFIDSTKFTFALAYVFSGVFMYLFAKRLTNKNGAFLISLLYLFAPYRFVDLYVRAALGEHLAFMVMPLVLLSFSMENIVFAGISLAILLLSHNAISLMFLPFLIVFLIVRRFNLWKAGISFILGFGLSAFFWLPAYLEGKYTLRDIVTSSEYAKNFPDFSSLIYSPFYQVGIIHWIVVILAVFYFFKNRLVAVSLVFFSLSLLLMNRVSLPVWETLTILQKFQFPWRFLTLAVLTSSLCAIVIRNKLTLWLCLLTVVLSLGYWKINGTINKPDNYFINQYQGTTDTGESSPIWSIRGIETKSSKSLRIIDGQSKVKNIVRKSNLHEYQLDVKTRTRFVEDTVYFPGWKVFANGREVPVEFQDPNHRGLITFYLEPGEWQVKIVFVDTKLRLFANWISAITLGIIVLYEIIRRTRRLQ